jgi:hypothetical protein
MTSPVASPNPISVASDNCKARFDGFRHRIRDANRIEMARVGGIARTRDDSDVRSQRADLSYDFVDCGLCGNRDDYSSRVCKATTL